MRSTSDAIVSRIRLSGALAAVAALSALAAIGPPAGAQAATTGFDQITGAGLTNSALTVSWTQGLLDSSNNPIAAANADRGSGTPTSPASFMYADFKNLQVTVSQTQNITNQGITVTWKGGQPTVTGQAGVGAVAGNYLQLMECYGDANAGPSPQDCEFGAEGQLGSGPTGAVGTRQGELCATDLNGNTLPPSTSSPPASLNGESSSVGCDPEEPAQGASPPDTDSTDFPQQYAVPFVPVGNPSQPAYTQLDTTPYFNQFNTNEVDAAVTNPDGTGQVQFEAMTGTQAPGLGCGLLESNGQPQNCWLVIVPRGEFEPNGLQINPNIGGPAGYLVSSALSASNWAMRIQIHLSYAAVPNFCPINTKEVETVGTQIVARAVQSWQLALNKAANCTTVYGYSAVPEATSTQQLAQAASGGAGLAFTTIPIGSEAARNGGSGSAASLPPILYAPVAVSALDFGFNINFKTGFISTPIELTPEVLAKALTQVYQTDLPDYDVNPGAGVLPIPGPAWATTQNISQDDQFRRLNPEVPKVSPAYSLAPLLTEDHSALNEQIWEWIQADPGAAAWLDNGTHDNANFDTQSPDPDYTPLQLGAPPAIDSFPRAYTGVLDLGACGQCSPQKEETRDSLDLLPYVTGYGQAAANIIAGNNPTSSGTWDLTAIAPDGSLGWWDKNGQQPIGQVFIWGISDTPDLAGFGLIDAQLCNDSGSSCVGPSTASLTTALNSAKPDSAGLLQVDPANPGAGGYPLTQVVYAAVATNQPAADLSADADLIAYAAGTGQTPGAAAGQLPPGYLPMSASLQAQANAVVNQLRADAQGSTSSPSTSASTSQTSGTPAGGGSGSTSLTPTGAGASLSSATPTTGPSITPPRAELAAQTTRPQPVGAIRWLLLAVVIAGAACAIAGTVLLYGGNARWLHRMRS